MLNEQQLKAEMIQALRDAGFNTDNEYSRTKDMAGALSKSIVAHFKANAVVKVTSGSSAGQYKVE